MSSRGSAVSRGSRRLVVNLLGPPEILWGTRQVVIPRRQVRAILYRLAVIPQAVPRDILYALFWPDVPTSVACAHLSRLLYFLKRALPDPTVLRIEEGYVGLDMERTWCDTWALAAALQPEAGEAALVEAAHLYRGEFLEGFFFPQSAEYELWMVRERHRWQQCVLQVLNRLMDLAEARGDYEGVIRWGQRYLSVDEASEAVHRRLIRAYGILGQREKAAAQFERCMVALERELGVTPLPETRAAYEEAVHGREARPALRAGLPWPLRTTVKAPFVGRQAILRRLHEMYAQAAGGQPVAVFISGEAGIGKTRLVQEFVAGLPPEARVMALLGRRAGRWQPYAALVEGIRLLLARLEPWQREALHPRLERLAPLFPDLSPSPGDRAGPRPQHGGSSQTAVWEGFDGLISALVRTCGPLVLCVDDAPYVDEPTRAWLGHWLATAVGIPTLVLITYRPEERAAVAPLYEEASHGSSVYTVRLAGLGRSAVEALVRHGLGSADPRSAEALAGPLLALTGGNPFFLLEVLRTLPEATDPRVWLARKGLPESVKEVVNARLEQLDPQSRRVLETVAVLGPHASLEVLVETSGLTEDAVLAALEALLQQGLLVEKGSGFVFAHDLVQEHTYRRMLDSRRRLLHRRVAHALQRRVPHERATVAWHYQAAGEFEEAARWWILAGDAARQVYAHEEALRCYERGLALQRLRGDAKGAAGTLMRIGLVHHAVFDYARAARAYADGFVLWKQAEEAGGAASPLGRALRIDWPQVATLDPALAANANSGGVIEHLFRGLVEWDPDLNVVPDAAREWAIEDDGRVYIFRLREDMSWSDGAPVRAQDFVTAWRRVVQPGGRSPFVRLLFPIRHARAYRQGELRDPERLGVRALDDLTLEVELEHPCSFFLHLMAHPVARPVPSHLIARAEGAWCQPEVLVTNGAFQVERWDQQGCLALARSWTYRGAWPGNVDRVVLHLGVEHAVKQEKWRLYQENRLDVFTMRWGLSPEEMAFIRREYADQLISTPNFFVRFLAFNIRSKPFDDPRVRQAFAHAVDRQVVACLMGGDLRPASGGMLPPGMPGHTEGLSPAFDPAQARRLMDAAGYPGGRGLPDLTFMAFPGSEAAGEYMATMWRRLLGVAVTLQVLPLDVYMQRLQEGPWPELFLAGWVADYPDPDSLLRVPAISERTGWQDREYEQLIAQAMGLRRPEERWRLYRQADARLMEQLPIFPLAYSCWSILRKPWVRVFPVSAFKWWFWKHVVLD